jgi:hypothetical protein
LHPFELSWKRPERRFDMFDRGRIDHFGVTAPSMEALLEIRERLLAENDCAGVTDAQIRDFGPLYSLQYVDPDGVELEINAFKDQWRERDVLHRTDWKTVEPSTVPA